MANRYTPVDIRVRDGGRLISKASSDTAGVQHYVLKRDWRRDLDVEQRREGYDYIWPNTDIPLGNQPFPTGVPVDITAVGIHGSPFVSVGVHKGYTYKITLGVNESFLENGSGGPQYAGSVSVEFQALSDTVFIYAANLGQPYTYELIEYDPITLLHLARRPNGKTAWIAGTPTTLYRYFGLDQGAYKAGNGTPDAYIEETGPNTPYFDDNPGLWIVIGSGFTVGAQRWEAVNINGWAIFNNGVDLPVSYRVEDLNVIPMYELRESGIASVGTIAEFGGILMLMDISTIQPAKLTELFDMIGVTRSGAGGSLTAQQAGNTVTTTDDFFTLGVLGDIGRTIIFEDGKTKNITVVTDARTVTVDGPAETIPSQQFKLRTRASQAGSLYSGASGISGTQVSGSPDVAANGPIFNPGMAGTTQLRYANGWQANIITYVSPSDVILDANAPDTFTNVPFYIISLPEQNSADYQVVAQAALFTPAMVGRELIWNSGTVKRIVAYVDEFNVMVDTDWSVGMDLVGIENPATYAPFTDQSFIDRVQYRITWSMPDQPRRFSPVFIGSITAGQSTLRLEFPVKSIEAGRQLLISGAGAAGGQLIANVMLVSGQLVVRLDEPASTTVLNADVFYADAVSSIVGFEDLQDDGSGIIRALELNGVLVIYKDTSIFLATYTGEVDQPFIFRLKKMPSSKALFYRYTLVLVAFENPAQNFHLYAGRDSFYRFDLTTQFPANATEFELCKNIFFDKANLEYTNWIFAWDNIITKEIFFVTFPFTQDERVLAYDYLFSTVSTSSMVMSAGASGKRPEVTSIGETEDWALLGTPKGVVLHYGKASLPQSNWANAKEIYYRREQNPFSAVKGGYTSILQSGQDNFGSAFNEKDIRSLLPYLSSQSPTTQLLLELLGNRNVAETPAVVDSRTLPDPKTSNLMPTFARRHYWGFRITVSGMENPIRLAQLTMEISGVDSRSFVRRPM